MVRLALVLLGALPAIAWLSSWLPALRPLALAVDPWFAVQCHRDPQRTLVLLGERLPVCARCTGIYAGLLLGAASARPRVAVTALVRATLAFAGLLLGDVLGEALSVHLPSLGERFATGVLFAFPAAVAVVLAQQQGAAARRATTGANADGSSSKDGP